MRVHDDDDDDNYNNIKTITIEHQQNKKKIIMIGSYNMLLSSIRVYWERRAATRVPVAPQLSRMEPFGTLNWTTIREGRVYATFNRIAATAVAAYR